jgi:hypothetical protein
MPQFHSAEQLAKAASVQLYVCASGKWWDSKTKHKPFSFQLGCESQKFVMIQVLVKSNWWLHHLPALATFKILRRKKKITPAVLKNNRLTGNKTWCFSNSFPNNVLNHRWRNSWSQLLLVFIKIYLPPQYDQQLFTWKHFLVQPTSAKKPSPRQR